MSTPGSLIQSARRHRDLSQDELAARAGVPLAMLVQIEIGLVDPTVGMLTQLLDAAGASLQLEYAPRSTIADLTGAWRPRPTDAIDRIDFARIQSLLDHLRLHPDETAGAIDEQPPPTGSPLMDNLLAAIAEKLADDAQLSRPRWTRDIVPLEVPHITPGEHGARRHAVESAPAQLAARGVILEAITSWPGSDESHGNEVAPS